MGSCPGSYGRNAPVRSILRKVLTRASARGPSHPALAPCFPQQDVGVLVGVDPMTTTFYKAMNEHGFSDHETASVRKTLTCPRCGFNFSLVYARAFACQGCSEAVRGCNKVRCNKCDYDFPILNSTDIQNTEQQRSLSDHMSSFMYNRGTDRGISSFNR